MKSSNEDYRVQTQKLNQFTKHIVLEYKYKEDHDHKVQNEDPTTKGVQKAYPVFLTVNSILADVSATSSWFP